MTTQFSLFHNDLPELPSFTEMMKSARTADEGRSIIKEYEEAFAEIEKSAGLPHSVGKGGSGYAGRGYSTLTKREKATILKTVSMCDSYLGQRLETLIADIDASEPHWRALLDREYEKYRRGLVAVKDPEEAEAPNGKPYEGLTPGTREWKRVWVENPELQAEMLEYKKEEPK
jgi:hypothetical protein